MCGREEIVARALLERGSSGGKEGAVVVKRMDRNLGKGERSPTRKGAVLAAAAVFVVVFLLALLIFDWIASGALGIFMAFFSGAIAMEPGS